MDIDELPNNLPSSAARHHSDVSAEYASEEISSDAVNAEMGIDMTLWQDKIPADQAEKEDHDLARPSKMKVPDTFAGCSRDFGFIFGHSKKSVPPQDSNQVSCHQHSDTPGKKHEKVINLDDPRKLLTPERKDESMGNDNILIPPSVSVNTHMNAVHTSFDGKKHATTTTPAASESVTPPAAPKAQKTTWKHTVNSNLSANSRTHATLARQSPDRSASDTRNVSNLVEPSEEDLLFLLMHRTRQRHNTHGQAINQQFQLEKQNTKLRTVVSSLREEKQVLSRNLEAVRNDNESLTQKLEDFQNRYEKLKKWAKEFNLEYSALRETADSFQADLLATKEDGKELKNTVQELRFLLEKTGNAVQEGQRELTEASSNVALVSERLQHSNELLQKERDLRQEEKVKSEQYAHSICRLENAQNTTYEGLKQRQQDILEALERGLGAVEKANKSDVQNLLQTCISRFESLGDQDSLHASGLKDIHLSVKHCGEELTRIQDSVAVLQQNVSATQLDETKLFQMLQSRAIDFQVDLQQREELLIKTKQLEERSKAAERRCQTLEHDKASAQLLSTGLVNIHQSLVNSKTEHEESKALLAAREQHAALEETVLQKECMIEDLKSRLHTAQQEMKQLLDMGVTQQDVFSSWEVSKNSVTPLEEGQTQEDPPLRVIDRSIYIPANGTLVTEAFQNHENNTGDVSTTFVDNSAPQNMHEDSTLIEDVPGTEIVPDTQINSPPLMHEDMLLHSSEPNDNPVSLAVPEVLAASEKSPTRLRSGSQIQMLAQSPEMTSERTHDSNATAGSSVVHHRPNSAVKRSEQQQPEQACVNPKRLKLVTREVQPQDSSQILPNANDVDSQFDLPSGSKASHGTKGNEIPSRKSKVRKTVKTNKYDRRFGTEQSI